MEHSNSPDRPVDARDLFSDERLMYLVEILQQANRKECLTYVCPCGWCVSPVTDEGLTLADQVLLRLDQLAAAGDEQS